MNMHEYANEITLPALIASLTSFFPFLYTTYTLPHLQIMCSKQRQMLIYLFKYSFNQFIKFTPDHNASSALIENIFFSYSSSL